MKQKSVHEPSAQLMSAADVWYDAQQVAQALRQNLLRAEPSVRLQMPMSVFLSALDSLSQEELLVLRQQVNERLAEMS